MTQNPDNNLVTTSIKILVEDKITNLLMMNPDDFRALEIWRYGGYADYFFDQFYSRPEDRSDNFIRFLLRNYEHLSYAVDHGLQGLEISEGAWHYVYAKHSYLIDDLQLTDAEIAKVFLILRQLAAELPVGYICHDSLINLIRLPESFVIYYDIVKIKYPNFKLRLTEDEKTIEKLFQNSNLDHLLYAGVTPAELSELNLIMRAVDHNSILVEWLIHHDLAIPQIKCVVKWQQSLSELCPEAREQLLAHIIAKKRFDLFSQGYILNSYNLLRGAVNCNYLKIKFLEQIKTDYYICSYTRHNIERVLAERYLRTKSARKC